MLMHMLNMYHKHANEYGATYVHASTRISIHSGTELISVSKGTQTQAYLILIDLLKAPANSVAKEDAASSEEYQEAIIQVPTFVCSVIRNLRTHAARLTFKDAVSDALHLVKLCNVSSGHPGGP
jgi:hypothetical protein